MSKFFDKMRTGLARFMYGRNGADPLNVAIFILYLAVILIRVLVVALTTNVTVYTFFNALAFALALLYLFRAFSRNLEKRRGENQHFLRWWGPKQQALRSWNQRRRDKTHCYLKCRHCGAWCRVPRGKGTIEITCPKCHEKTVKKT